MRTINFQKCTGTSARCGSCGADWETYVMVGGVQNGVSPVLQDGDTGGPAVGIVFLGYIGHYYEGGVGLPCGVPPPYHG